MDTFRIGLDGSDVIVRLVGIKNHDLPLRFTTPGTFYARILHDALMEEMGNMFRSIRQTAYEQGWKDARAKTRKRDWFSSAFGR